MIKISHLPSWFLLPGLFLMIVSLSAGEAEKSETKGEKAEEKTVAEDKAEKDDAPDKEGDDADKEKKDEKKEAKLHEVKAEPFEVTLELTGVVEGTDESPIALRPESWSSLVVVKVAPHGTRVKKGDVLIELETDKLEEAIDDLKAGFPQQEISLLNEKLELEKLEKTTPLSLESARRSKMKAEEDFAYFEDVSKPMRIRDAHEDLKSTENYLSYAEEELNQLKKMYEQDDLTEETEEIILKRAQHSVDTYTWMLEQTKARTDRSLNTLIPREEESLKRSLESKQIEWRAGEQSMRSELEKKKIDFAKSVRDFEKSQEKLEDLESDLEAMTVRAPQDGIVYYGMSQRGKWTTASTVERKLIPGGTISPKEIMMTVVGTDDLRLRMSVPEDKLKDLKEGQKAETALKWNPEEEFESTVESISYVPYSNNTFDSVFAFKPKKDQVVLPGMSAKVEIEVYRNEKALLVPKGAVKEEDDETFVYLKGGKKRKVETGRTDGKMTEILKGLREGVEVNLSDPSEDDEDEKPSAKKPEKKSADAAKKP